MKEDCASLRFNLKSQRAAQDIMVAAGRREGAKVRCEGVESAPARSVRAQSFADERRAVWGARLWKRTAPTLASR